MCRCTHGLPLRSPCLVALRDPTRGYRGLGMSLTSLVCFSLRILRLMPLSGGSELPRIASPGRGRFPPARQPCVSQDQRRPSQTRQDRQVARTRLCQSVRQVNLSSQAIFKRQSQSIIRERFDRSYSVHGYFSPNCLSINSQSDSLISGCLGTADLLPVCGFTYKSCNVPCRCT